MKNFGCLFLMLFVVGCSGNRESEPVSSSMNAEPSVLYRGNVPISGGLDGSVTPTTLSPRVFRWEVAAAGNISHMGYVTASLVFPEVEVNLASATVIVRSGTWRGVMTAPNGDQLFGTYTVRNESTTLDATGRVGFIADLMATGGTGRFQGATGTGLVTGHGNLFGLTFSLSIRGNISHVGN